MNRAKGFAEDLEAISANVENEVGRYVKLLRHETRETPRSPDARQVTKPQPQQETKAGGSPAEEPAAAPPAEAHTRTPPKPRPKAALVEKIVRENVSMRLRPETNELLTEAALRQKLKKEIPDTRQDIVDEALQDWFRKHGYVR